MKKITKIELTPNNYKKYIKKENTVDVVRNAFELGYSVHKFTNTKMIRISNGEVTRHIVGFINALNSFSAYHYANNKLFTEILLKDAGVHTTTSVEISRKEWLLSKRDFYHGAYPAVAKPKKDTICGDGVKLNIKNEAQLYKELKESFTEYGTMLVQEQFNFQNEYRLLVLDGKVLAGVQRMHAYVYGDGVHTIEELVEAKNAARQKHRGCELRPILFNASTILMLEKANMTRKSIPAKDQYVRLQPKNNLDYGGESKDVTDIIPEETANIAVQAASAVGLRLAGIDIITNDISVPLTPETGFVCEVNHNPFILFHEYPVHGTQRNVTKNILKALLNDD